MIDPVEFIAASTADADTIVDTGSVNRNIGRWYEATVTRPFIFHGSIGPAAAVALWDGDEATVWTHSQGVFQLRKAISVALGTVEEKLQRHPQSRAPAAMATTGRTTWRSMQC